ncbi:FlgO family outer membrane protein [Undibacterium sp.]|uniref:FlgO family outer membrane protein n=1 Tax=Undibacterium sp. TaxID=1914977 RepID=UPI002731FD61|nr:FlgO family outer membrane protein [Undibacterium sp.]MDP1978801.1 FlgO family outer membrane protein [Undibacterium sp.]
MMKSAALVIASAIALSACANLGLGNTPPPAAASPAPTWKDAEANEFIPANQRAANVLITNAASRIDPSRPLIIATLANINFLEESSAFGRIIAEHVSGEFTRQQYKMVEMKFRDKVFMKQNVGELLLTREIRDVAQNHSAQAVIVGTYAESDKLVYVNLKLVKPSDNTVISSVDYAVPMDKNTKALLGRR